MKIKNRSTIYIVEEITDYGYDGGLLSRNIRAFTTKEAAEYFCSRLNDRNTYDLTCYQVSVLKLLEAE